MRVRILTNGPSNGARALRDTLRAEGIECNKVNINDKLTNRPAFNIKWGCFTHPAIVGELINGMSSDVSLNKLSCFRALEGAGVPVPDFTTERQVAEGWGAERIYERHKLRASEGDGIVIKSKGEPLGAAPLYVKGCYGKRREYRIHVFLYEGMLRTFIQQKKRKTTDVEATTAESRIRNLANGWIFAHQEIQVPREATTYAAINAIRSLGLDFGAVDLIEMDKGGSYVLEVNCAPGLQGATLFFYADCIKRALNPVQVTEEEEE